MLALLLIVMSTVSVTDADPSRHVHHTVVTLEPEWIAEPTHEDFEREYPPFAKSQHIIGRVVVECIAREDGSLADCAVVSESPANDGFGPATLKLTPKYRLRDAKGRPIKGFKARLTVVWGVV
jgi:protein TonB